MRATVEEDAYVATGESVRDVGITKQYEALGRIREVAGSAKGVPGMAQRGVEIRQCALHARQCS